jgi:hypothetical protein
MRGGYLTLSVCVASSLQLISYPAAAQTVAVPDGARVVCPNASCSPPLVRRSDGVLVVAPAGVATRRGLTAEVAPGGAAGTPVDGVQPPVANQAIKTFGGLSLGVGIGARFDTQGQPRVASATAPNNIVRISETSNVGVSLVGESHYFFVPNNTFFGVPAGDWGTGPFVAIDASTNNNNSVISGYSIGWMIGFRSISWAQDPNSRQLLPTFSATSSWNFGVGFRVDPNAQVLGDGIVANAPLPAGDTVRFKNEARYGIMLLSSFSF